MMAVPAMAMLATAKLATAMAMLATAKLAAAHGYVVVTRMLLTILVHGEHRLGRGQGYG